MANSMFQWIFTAILSVLHPFYVSVIEISHHTKEATAELSIRVFTDDLEKTLQKHSSIKVDLTQPKNRALMDQQLNEYISKHLGIKINGKPVKANYVGYEIIQESVWCYFEITDVHSLNTLEVECSILYDFERSQVNIIHAKSKGLEKSYKLNFPEQFAKFNF